MAFLGSEGLKSFEFAATQLIPKSFGNVKTARVCNIVNHHCRSGLQITEEIVENLIPFLVDQDKNHMLNSLLHLTERSGDAYTMFIVPPVERCTNSLCKKFGQPNSLSANHPPTDVVVFDVDRPLLASKQCLRCKSCSTIYNYNKFGRKNKKSETDDTAQDLLEVTDVTYITKMLYSLYRSLWSVKIFIAICNIFVYIIDGFYNKQQK